MTSSVPEPAQDPVADALRMRASDADRERVAGLLRDAFAEGRLSPVEHEERLADVYRAATYGDLVPVLADLPVPPGTLAVPHSSGEVVAVSRSVVPGEGSAALVVAPDMAGQGEASTVAVFGGFQRRGRWVVAPKLSATCVFGGGELDLSQAVLTSRDTEIQVVCVFGGLELTVPEGVALRVEASAVFGGHDRPPEEPTAPDAPLIRVTGFVLFGGVAIKRPKPGTGSRALRPR